MSDVIRHYLTPAHTLEVGDQIIIDGEECIITQLTDCIDDIVIRVENLGTGPDEFVLPADNEYWIWSI